MSNDLGVWGVGGGTLSINYPDYEMIFIPIDTLM